MIAASILGRKWLAIGLSLLFVPLAWRAWTKLDARAKRNVVTTTVAAAPAPETASAPSSPPPKPTDADLAILAQLDERLALPVETDPFRPLPDAAPTRKTDGGRRPTLEAISIRAGRGLAVIDDRLLGEGDEIDGFKVESIARDRVSLRRGDDTLVLELEPLDPPSEERPK